MTSSLVGSEMCIRDSHCDAASQFQDHKRVKKIDKTSAEAASKEVRSRPVSYTHLTLPTICSV
eukprot:6816818-Prorocentrum_lima.AAC.1